MTIRGLYYNPQGTVRAAESQHNEEPQLWRICGMGTKRSGMRYYIENIGGAHTHTKAISVVDCIPRTFVESRTAVDRAQFLFGTQDQPGDASRHVRNTSG